MKFSNYTLFCQNLAKTGGEIALKSFNQKKYKVSTKADRSYVTSTDIKIESTLKDLIKKTYPDHSIHGEELKNDNRSSSFTWYIDPIDGTLSFVLGIPAFCVMVALVKDNQVISSSISIPYDKKIYTAETKKGAYLNRIKLKAKQTYDPTKAILFVNRVIGTDKQLYSFLLKHSNKFKTVKRLFSCGFSNCLLVENKIHAYLSFGQSPHDFCATSLITKEAGFETLDHNLKPWQPNNSTDLVVFPSGLKSFFKKIWHYD